MLGDNLFHHELDFRAQLSRLVHSRRLRHVTELAAAACQHHSPVGDIEVLDAKPVLVYDGLEHFRTRGTAHQQQRRLANMEAVAHRRVQSVNHSLELRADAVKIDGRRNDEHIGLRQLGIDALHIVGLHALMAFGFKALVAATTGTHIKICHGDNLRGVAAAHALHKCAYQLVGITATAHTSGKDYDVHRMGSSFRFQECRDTIYCVR